MFTTRKAVKCVVVGDPTVGKTCMMITHLRNRFPEEYVPTVLENHAENLSVRGVEVRLALWDTAGHEEYDRLRPLAYPKTDVVVLCFSVANYDSFKNIPDLWYPEIAHYCQNVPIILVGNKIDLRDDPSALSQPEQLPQVTKEQAMQMAERIKAVRYIECSAKTQEGLKEVFVTATEVGVFPELYVPNRSRRRRRVCSLL